MNLPVLSYTFLNTYDICPKQAFHRYVSKDAPFVGTDASRWGNVVHEAFEKRLGEGKPLPIGVDKWEHFAKPLEPLKPRVEVKMGILRDGSPTGFFDPNVWLRGKADVVAIQGTTAYLPDWKTGKRREDPYELEVLALLVSAWWIGDPLTRIIGQYVWLQDNALGKPHDVSNVGETLEVLQDKAAEIEANHAKGYWPKKQGPLCGFCPVHSCEFNRVKR